MSANWSFSLSGKQGKQVELNSRAVDHIMQIGQRFSLGCTSQRRRELIAEANRATGSSVFITAPRGASAEERDLVALGILSALQKSIDINSL